MKYVYMFAAMFTILTAGLKLFGILDLSWIVITSPLWTMAVLFTILFIIGLLKATYDAIRENRQEKKSLRNTFKSMMDE